MAVHQHPLSRPRRMPRAVITIRNVSLRAFAHALHHGQVRDTQPHAWPEKHAAKEREACRVFGFGVDLYREFECRGPFFFKTWHRTREVSTVRCAACA
eukprot:3655644-Rhodomonas_salina.1